MKATAIASQRLQPAHSPSIGPARAVIIMGPKNMIDMASASCNVRSAKKLNTVAPTRNMPRSSCSGRLFTRNVAMLVQLRSRIRARIACSTNRIHDTNCGDIPDVTRYFALVSRQAKARPLPSSSQMAAGGVAASVSCRDWVNGSDA